MVTVEITLLVLLDPDDDVTTIFRKSREVFTQHPRRLAPSATLL